MSISARANIDDPNFELKVSVSIPPQIIAGVYTSVVEETASISQVRFLVFQGKSGKSPFIGANGNWYSYNDSTFKYEDTGTSASVASDMREVTDLEIEAILQS